MLRNRASSDFRPNFRGVVFLFGNFFVSHLERVRVRVDFLFPRCVFGVSICVTRFFHAALERRFSSPFIFFSASAFRSKGSRKNTNPEGFFCRICASAISKAGWRKGFGCIFFLVCLLRLRRFSLSFLFCLFSLWIILTKKYNNKIQRFVPRCKLKEEVATNGKISLTSMEVYREKKIIENKWHKKKAKRDSGVVEG